ncbi:TPA: RHS repeat-associated core domain-containing protein [Burkholderia cepacia]|uniref:RHS repeat-associated core domain-containing protein n=1 Tax=Burkholderia cepacia TaxID=292 RepID=UPI001CF55E7C|nr:RHS repeat-associated core domain-containing protein [Burkholderia cepacia]MCA8358124.1 DUF6531 domain-containing protein [Burkholderia cepacia]HDR9762972.1 RHS domain-containing protein [Burkholderia cepacia ATCC 25416]HDV6371779.1 RHS domain-containing protein [Burkholderia cepacia]
MALLAVKHLDPVVGVDVHSVLVTPGTPPVFLPHPHVGFMLDLREYIQAAKAVAGCIAMMIVQEKVTECIEDHPEDVAKLEHLADEAGQQVNELTSDPNVAEGMKLAKAANTIRNRIGDDLGSNVGSGGGSGRPIFVNGMMRATAGTHAYHVPGLHFPLGESFAPPPAEFEPSNDGESFMGSKTVLANNDPMSYMALEALSCWSIGMEPPPHNSAHTDRTYPSMPSSVMLPIPAGRPVLVGGPPIMNMAAAAKGLFKAFQGSKWAKTLADKLHLKPGFLRCKVLHAEPVDASTGEVVVEQRDFIVSGRLPLEWDRYYSSHDTHVGAVGAGWQTPADIRLELLPNDDAIGVVAHLPDHTTAFDALPATEGWSSRECDWQQADALYLLGDRLLLRTRESIEYGFPLPPQWQQTIIPPSGESRPTLPIHRISDPNGNAWVFERDQGGRLERIAEWRRDGATGRVIACEIRDAIRHDANGAAHAGLLTALTLVDANGHAHPLVTYEHDRDSNLRAAVDAMGCSYRFDYADGHRIVRHTTARGMSFHYHYCTDDDGVWRVDHAWGDDGLFDYRFVYDRTRMQTRITNSLGHTTVLQLNAQGMPVFELDPLGGVTSYRYEARGRTSVATDAAGRITSWAYDRRGNLVMETLPDGRSIRTEYDSNHHPVCVTLPGERQWRYEWDERGNLLAQTTPSNATSRYEYDSYGQLVAQIGPCGELSRLEYDRDGHLAAVTDPLGHRTLYRHDARGHLVEVIDALGQTSRYEYDRNGNLTRAIEPSGKEILCGYDADGNLTHYRDPAGATAQLQYSTLGRITKRISLDGTSVEYQYDTEGRLIGVINERGERYQLTRDAMGRIVEEVDYWGQLRRYEYGEFGELRRSVDPAGLAVLYLTDRFGRVVQKQVADSRQADGFRTEKFEYDRIGRLVGAQNPDSCLRLGYDDAGRLIEERQGDDFVIAYRYDTVGRRIERRTRLVTGHETVTHTVRYGYDAFGAVASIQIDDAAPVKLERDALGRICVEYLGEALRRELVYTKEGQLARQTLLSGTGAIFATEYTYDANGEMTEKRDSRLGIERFDYDPMGKLTAYLDPSGKLLRFLHDPAGDLLTTRSNPGHRTGVSDLTLPLDAWVREGEHDGCRYTFDRTGNLIRKRDAQQDLLLRWDGDGLLIETSAVRMPADPAIQASRIHTRYAYDVFQRRIRKTTQILDTPDAPAGSVSASTVRSHRHDYFWDGDALVSEIAHPGQNVDVPLMNVVNELDPGWGAGPVDISPADGYGESCEWVYYPGTFRPLAALRYAPKNRSDQSTAASESAARNVFFQTEPSGAPTRLIDQSSAIIWEGRYGAWGHVGSARMHAADDQPLRLQGQYEDWETGLHYNRYRYYDPVIGSFVSQDPIRIDGGINPYQYAPNVFGWRDPLGLKREETPFEGYQRIRSFRERRGLDLPNNPDGRFKTGDKLGSIGTILGSDRVYGINSTLRETQDFQLTRAWRQCLGLDGSKGNTFQFLFHSEAGTLLLGHREGLLGDEVTLINDRTTCAPACRPMLSRLLAPLGIGRLTVYSGGSMSQIARVDVYTRGGRHECMTGKRDPKL